MKAYQNAEWVSSLKTKLKPNRNANNKSQKVELPALTVTKLYLHLIQPVEDYPSHQLDR
jgi:hypothetical protein